MTSATPEGDVVDPFQAGRDLLTERAARDCRAALRRDDGEARVVSCAHAGVFDDEGALVRDVVIVHDVTRERQVERLKADFIATVSHELRTPVTPIKGYADLLRRRGHVMTEEKRAECLEIISDRAAHLARLVEDLLLASTISESGGRAKVELAGTTWRAVTAGGRRLRRRQRARDRLSIPESPSSRSCDPVRVTQVLTNLLGNAAEVLRPRARPSPRGSVRRRVRPVEVQDQGAASPLTSWSGSSTSSTASRTRS